MEIIVCVKRVPDVSEVELEVTKSGLGIEEADLTFGINEWDNFAVEEAVGLKEQHGGKVTAITVGDEDAEEVLRRALAMGADEALHLKDPSFVGSDSFATARILHSAIFSRPFDLVLTGAVSGDMGSGQVGGMLAGLLGVPQVALATGIEVSGGKLKVQHEVEGGLERIVEIDLPALVTVQTGINEPRYVSIRGIRKVSGVEIPMAGTAELGLSPDQVDASGSRVKLEELLLPPTGEGAEILEGSPEEAVATLVNRLREKGGL
jgi:electron transfer flavoprotein beta subunit